MFSRAPRRNSGSFLNTALRPTERRRSPELSDFPLHLCEIRKDQGESEMKKRFFALFLTMALLLPAVLLIFMIPDANLALPGKRWPVGPIAKVLALVLAAYRSAAEGKPVVL
mgnify:CR=1 FL=1